MAPHMEIFPTMIAHLRHGARLCLAAVLGSSLLAQIAIADPAVPAVKAWKLGYVRRMCDERMERQVSRGERVRELRARELEGRAQAGPKRPQPGVRARPGTPEPGLP